MKPKKVRGNGYKFINMGEIFAFNRMLNIPCDRVPLSEKEKETSLLKNGDLLFARQSLVLSGAGKCAIFIGDDEPVAFESHIIRVRPDTKQIVPQYLYYFFNSPIGRAEMWTIIEQGAGQAGIRGSDLEKLNIPYPSLPQQKAIAHILGSLDDKIELNRRMNETLEAMAQALFKSWFVDFDPVIDNAMAAGNEIPDALKARAATRQALGDARKPLPEEIRQLFPSSFEYHEEMGWVPEGWRVDQLGNLVVVKRGGSPRPIHDFLVEFGLPWVKIRDASSCTSRFLSKTKECIKPEGLKKTVFLKKGALILSNSATPGLPIFLDLDACIHDGWLYFPKKDTLNDFYLYQLFLVVRNELLMQGNGSVFTNLKTDILKDHFIVIPKDDIFTCFDLQISGIHEKLHAIQYDTETLTKLRDTLLPKLLSGQIRIPDAEKLVQEAL